MEILLGAVGAVLVIAAYIAGVLTASRLARNTAKIYVQPVEENSETVDKKRKELKEQQKAFQQMQHYNADMAYGIHSGDDFSGREST